MSEYEDLKKQLLGQDKASRLSRNWLSTGSTLLNLACSDQVNGGFAVGNYYFLVGDSASGKTFLSLTCLAEAAISKRFASYRFIYDNAENGALMDLNRFFGKQVATRLEQPHSGSPSATIEEFFWNLDDALNNSGEVKPCIYILDSMDVLSTEDEEEKFEERKDASRNGRQVSGSYGVSKAKANSAGIRRIIPRLRETGSILIIISQTRDNIGFGAQFNPKTRSGGHALRFYACLELWSSVQERITKVVRGVKRQLGILCKIQVKKNRLTGKERTINIPIYHSYGMDDVGSMVDWLIEEKHWSKHGANLTAPEFDWKGGRDKLLDWIETEHKEQELKSIVARVWNEIETACEVKRQRRY